MATYSTDVELGVTTGVDLVPGYATYIEGPSGTVGDSLTSLVDATIGNAELNTNTGSLTANNLTYYCGTFTCLLYTSPSPRDS